MPVTGTTAYRVDGASATALTVTGGKVSATLATLPINILSYPVTASGPAALRWVSGDRTKYTFQVLSTSGTVLRTVSTGVRSTPGSGRDLGRQDRRLTVHGTYRLRLTVLAPDGRGSTLQKDVAVP